MGGATLLLILNMNLGFAGSAPVARIAAIGLEYDASLVMRRPDYDVSLALSKLHHDAAAVLKRLDYEASE